MVGDGFVEALVEELMSNWSWRRDKRELLLMAVEDDVADEEVEGIRCCWDWRRMAAELGEEVIGVVCCC
jgi:hypothetical protein